MSTLLLAKLLAFCLSTADDSIAKSNDPVQKISRLSPETLERGADIFHEGLKRLLDDMRTKLMVCFNELAKKDAQGTNVKFQTFTMNCGNLEDFANGLSNRVGEHVLLHSIFISVLTKSSAGYPHDDLRKGMSDEHCVMYGQDITFETSNYGLRTKPSDEYRIATGEQPCPRDQMLDKRGNQVRVVRRLEDLMCLDIVRKSKLGREEVIAVVSALSAAFRARNRLR